MWLGTNFKHQSPETLIARAYAVCSQAWSAVIWDIINSTGGVGSTLNAWIPTNTHTCTHTHIHTHARMLLAILCLLKISIDLIKWSEVWNRISNTWKQMFKAVVAKLVMTLSRKDRSPSMYWPNPFSTGRMRQKTNFEAEYKSFEFIVF